MYWPSATDPFNLANPADNLARKNYYNVTGTPTFKCDGGACSATQAAAQAAINARLAISSPIWLDEIIALNGGNLVVTVKAVVTQNITSGYTLQIAVLDRYSYLPASPNGQPHHYHAMLAMAPSGNGQNFTATANDTMTYTGSVPMGPTWSMANLDVACFVQNNSTKEIIQGHIEQAPVNFPGLQYVSHTLDDNNNHDGRAEPGETAYLRVTLGNQPSYQPATNVVATLSTTDPTLTITTPTANYPDIPNGGQATNTSNPFVFTVASTATPHTTTLHLHVVANPQQTSYDVDIPISIGWPDIFLVDDDGAGIFETYYQSAITGINKTYEYWNVNTQGTPTADLMNHFDYTIWLNGHVSVDPINTAEQTLITNYLNGGGNLFISGQNIASGLNTSAPMFLQDVMHATFVIASTGIRLLDGVAGNPVGNGLTLNCNAGGTGSGSATSPDGITAIFGASTAFTYTGSTYQGALTYQGTGKLVFFSFPFEAISGQNASNTREQVLQSIMNWFGSAVPPSLDVNITAAHPPIVIPANGGPFQYNISVHNLTTTPQAFQVWNKIRAGSTYFQVFGPVSRSLPGGANPSRTLIQNVAATIPAGTNYYISYIGTYPGTIQDSSFFTFTKSAAADGGPWISESNCYGNFLDEYAVENAPTEFALVGAYPNPFNPTTTISFTLPDAGSVKLSVFDVNGREVANLVNGYRTAGSHNVTFDASHLTSGVYIYRLFIGDQTASGKMVLLK
ncbi:MAG: T9SS type A sorting domain-containing protein [bacterium]|nr:T9SS type A sorting domain-containing protein [bacterium]